jgi:hypothetical protein
MMFKLLRFGLIIAGICAGAPNLAQAVEVSNNYVACVADGYSVSVRHGPEMAKDENQVVVTDETGKVTTYITTSKVEQTSTIIRKVEIGRTFIFGPWICEPKISPDVTLTGAKCTQHSDPKRGIYSGECIICFSRHSEKPECERVSGHATVIPNN